MLSENLNLFPVSIIEDRYQGSYSHGVWIAIANADELEGGIFRIAWCLENGPYSDDVSARQFWAAPPIWIAAGDTPDEAIENLIQKMS